MRRQCNLFRFGSSYACKPFHILGFGHFNSQQDMRDGFTCECNQGFYDLNLDDPGRKCAEDLPCCKVMEVGVLNHPHYNAICEAARTQENGFIDYRNCFTNLTLIDLKGLVRKQDQLSCKSKFQSSLVEFSNVNPICKYYLA